MVTWLMRSSPDRTVRVRAQDTLLSQCISPPRDPFLERPGNLTGPKSYFEVKVSRKVGCVLTSNEVCFVYLAHNFTVQFSNFLKLLSGMENKTA